MRALRLLIWAAGAALCGVLLAGAIRENVARHPNADATTLTWLSKDRSQPLWYLVAFNPNTPTSLQRRLRDRLKRLGENQASK